MKFALRIEKELKRSTCLYGFDFDNFDGTDFIEIIDDALKNNSKWNCNSNVKGKRTENIFLNRLPHIIFLNHYSSLVCLLGPSFLLEPSEFLGSLGVLGPLGVLALCRKT